MRRPRRPLAVLAALCLLALAACGSISRPDPAAPAPSGVPTEDPREIETATEDPREADIVPIQQPAVGLDLRDLPTLPVLATGEQSAVGLLYETSSGVDEGITFYQGELDSRGWRERPDDGYVQAAAGLLVVERDGALLSVSVSDLGETRMVQLRHYGAVNLDALPLYPGAEVIFAQAMQLIYATPASVMEVTAFTREALARQGWLAYERPFTAAVEDPALRLLSLTRNGASLSAMISVAPAQGGRTTVQLVLGLMPVALPLPADATSLLLDAEWPYASYTTGVSQEELLALYRGGMAALGWREDREGAWLGDDGATLLFLRGEEEATLELTPGVSGRTAVLLSPPGAGVDPASAEAAEFETAPGPGQDTAPIDAALNDTIPLPVDAYDVEADPDEGPAGSLRASSLSSVGSLLVWYRALLPEQGWEEQLDAAEGDDRQARLTFTRPGAVLRLELRRMADGATAIRATTAQE